MDIQKSTYILSKQFNQVTVLRSKTRSPVPWSLFSSLCHHCPQEPHSPGSYQHEFVWPVLVLCLLPSHSLGPVVPGFFDSVLCLGDHPYCHMWLLFLFHFRMVFCYMWVQHGLFTYLIDDGPLGSFQSGTIANMAAINFLICVFWWLLMHITTAYTPTGDTAEPWCLNMLSFSRFYQAPSWSSQPFLNKLEVSPATGVQLATVRAGVTFKSAQKPGYLA